LPDKANLADMTGKRQIKINCYLNLSECCKKLRKYDFSIRFLKKALQYAWYFKEDSKELLIYDKLGLINYLSGDLFRAKYYHDRLVFSLNNNRSFFFRFVNSRLEASSSPCKFSSQEILLKVFEYTKFEGNSINGPISASHMTVLILTRLGLNKEWNEKTNSPMFKRKEVEEKKEDVSFFFKRKQGELDIPSVKFFTNIDVEVQLESIFQSKEFQYDVSSPRYPVDQDKVNVPKTKINNKAYKKIHTIFNKTVNIFRIFRN